ncbi:hypothetical protein [Pleurocapsa sp. PCC 7319]|nr:hypothetical protein [Pleurocapsa sp. PCC 7319]
MWAIISGIEGNIAAYEAVTVHFPPVKNKPTPPLWCMLKTWLN